MGKRKEISVTVSYPKEENSLRELEKRKAKIMLEVLQREYGERFMERYVNREIK